VEEAPEAKPIYVVDTDTWIELHRHHKRRNYGVLWSRLDALADSRRLLVPEEVEKELGSDLSEDPVRFLRDHPAAIRGTAVLWERAAEVANRFPDLVDLAKPDGSADPYVVACALDERDRVNATLWPQPVVVVAQESRKGPTKMQIPDACDHYGLAVVKLQGLLDSEGWEDL
jgi:hypothetical protein